MEFYWLFCRHTTLFDLLPPIIGFFRFGKLWSSFDMGVKARINAPRLPDQYSHRHFIFALNRYVGANSRNAKTYKDLCDRRRRTSFKGKTLRQVPASAKGRAFPRNAAKENRHATKGERIDRCLHRQKVELSQEMRREKTNTRRSKLTLENAHIKEKKGRKNEQQRCGYFMRDVD